MDRKSSNNNFEIYSKPSHLQLDFIHIISHRAFIQRFFSVFIYFSSSPNMKGCTYDDYRTSYMSIRWEKKSVANPICMGSHLFISTYLLLDEIRKCTFNILYRVEHHDAFMELSLQITCVYECAFSIRLQRKSFPLFFASTRAKLDFLLMLSGLIHLNTWQTNWK